MGSWRNRKEQCSNCKWWQTQHGLVWVDYYDAWMLGYDDEKGFCDFHNDYSDGGFVCPSWSPSAPVGNKNGWN